MCTAWSRCIDTYRSSHGRAGSYTAAVVHVMFTMDKLISRHIIHELHCVSEKKRHPFYFCDIFGICHPILLIFGRNVVKQTQICTARYISFYMFALYLV